MRREGGGVSAGGAVFDGGVFARRARPSGPIPIELEENEDEPGVVFYAAVRPGNRPVTVVLHGMCSEPRRAYRHFAERIRRDRASDPCPRARQRCEGGGSIWSGRGFEADIEASVHRAFRVLLADESARGTLVGYSLGAFRARAPRAVVGPLPAADADRRQGVPRTCAPSAPTA